MDRVLSADDGIEAGKDTAKGIVGGEAVRQGEESLEPRELALAKSSTSCNPSPPVSSADKAMTKISSKVMLLRPRNVWILSGLEMLDDSRVHGDSHGVFSSCRGVLVRSIA